MRILDHIVIKTIYSSILFIIDNTLFCGMYNVEEYWSDVAERIDERAGQNVIAGDDEPYYRLKREKFLELFKEVDYKDKSVLEIGPGPGGNLKELAKLNPKKLMGADISQSMINIARQNVPKFTELYKTDGKSLPFESNSVDIVYSVTVLQHNTDETSLINLMQEMARVSANEVHLYERVEKKIKGDKLNFGRPVSYYENHFKDHGFKLKDVSYLNIQASYLLAGFTRKYLNSKRRIEGEPLNKLSLGIQSIFMPITRILDGLISQRRDLARIRLVKEN